MRESRSDRRYATTEVVPPPPLPPPASGPPPPRGIVRRLPALASPVYRRFLAGAFIGAVGSWMQATAQGWLVLDLTDSPAALGLVSAVGTLPILLFSVFAGVLADRVDRRRLLVGTQVFAAAIAVLLAILTTTGVVQLWQVALLAFLAGTASAVQTPAYQAIVSNLVDRRVLGSAVALNAAQFNLSRILGPAIAGAVIAAGGLQLAFWGNAGALLLVAVILATLRIAGAPDLARAQASLWSNLMDGIRYVRARRLIAVLILLAAAPALLILNYLVLLPVYARDVLEIGAPGLGLLSGGVGLGALTGALGLAALRPSGGSGRSLLLGLAVSSVALVIFAISRWVPLSVAALAVLGASQVVYYATTNTLLQVLVPGRIRGRVISLYVLTSWGLIPVGHLAAGVVAERFGPTITLVAGGILTLAVVGIVAAIYPAIRTLEAPGPDTPHASAATAGA
jgi:MFS family permease